MPGVILRAPWAAAVAAAAVLALAGCNEQPAEVASAKTAAPTAVSVATEKPSNTALDKYVAKMRVYAQCLRDHGYADAPDPDEYGRMRMGGPGVDPDVVNKAGGACEDQWPEVPAEVLDKLHPPGAAALTAAQIREEQQYAKCMQDHGAPGYPDPGPDGMPVPSTMNAYVDAGSPGEEQATAICNPKFGKQMPFPDGVDDPDAVG